MCAFDCRISEYKLHIWYEYSSTILLHLLHIADLPTSGVGRVSARVNHVRKSLFYGGSQLGTGGLLGVLTLDL